MVKRYCVAVRSAKKGRPAIDHTVLLVHGCFVVSGLPDEAIIKISIHIFQPQPSRSALI